MDPPGRSSCVSLTSLSGQNAPLKDDHKSSQCGLFFHPYPVSCVIPDSKLEPRDSLMGDTKGGQWPCVGLLDIYRWLDLPCSWNLPWKTNSMTKLWLDIIGLDSGIKSDDQLRYGRGRFDVLVWLTQASQVCLCEELTVRTYLCQQIMQTNKADLPVSPEVLLLLCVSPYVELGFIVHFKQVYQVPHTHTHNMKRIKKVHGCFLFPSR